MSLPEPVNTHERYLHAIAVRIDALCHMMSSFLEVYGEKNDISTENNVVHEKEEARTCIAKTKAGNPCKRLAMEGSDYCSTHSKE